MIVAVIVVLIVVSIFVFVVSTLAAVLVVGLAGPRQPQSRKVLIAAVAGPAFSLGCFGLLVLAEGAYDGIEMAVGLGAVSLVGMIVLAWPTAYLATRRLHRLTQFDASAFE